MDPIITIGIMTAISLIQWVRTRLIFNPVTAFCMGHVFALSGLVLTTLIASELTGFDRYAQIDIQPVSQVYAIAAVSFWLPWLIKPVRREAFTIRIYKETYWVAPSAKLGALILTLNISLACLILGQVPIIEMMRGSVTISQHLENLHSLPFGLMAMQTGLAMCLALNIATFLRRKKQIPLSATSWCLVSAAYALAALWQGNRQLILFLLFVLIARYSEGHPISIMKFLRRAAVILAGLVGFIFMFISIQNTRLQGEGASSLEILGYLTWPSLNMNRIIEEIPGGLATFWPNFTITELVPHRFRSNDYENIVMPMLFESSSPSGYISYWYMDWGVLGVVLGSLMLSFFSWRVFCGRTKSEQGMQLYILVMWSCATACIYSHFISLNNFVFPAVFLIFQRRLINAFR